MVFRRAEGSSKETINHSPHSLWIHDITGLNCNKGDLNKTLERPS